jgi:hypothetical protein
VRRAASLALAALCACAHAEVRSNARDVAPVSYRPIPSHLQRSVGLLRRLALPPVQVDASPQNPSYCMDACDSAGYGAELRASAARVLTDWRGYEVVRVKGGPELSELAAWARSSDGDDPPESLRARVQKLGAKPGCDGVMLIQTELTYLTWFDGVAWYATLTFAIPISMARIGTRVQADVFEVRSGRRVWSSRLRAGGAPGSELSHPAYLADELFDPLELALPRVLAGQERRSH